MKLTRVVMRAVRRRGARVDPIARVIPYDQSPTDPLAFGGALALLATIAFIASLVPTLRALRVDPMDALRTD